jgi:hypothetical protein
VFTSSSTGVVRLSGVLSGSMMTGITGRSEICGGGSGVMSGGDNVSLSIRGSPRRRLAGGVKDGDPGARDICPIDGNATVGLI